MYNSLILLIEELIHDTDDPIEINELLQATIHIYFAAKAHNDDEDPNLPMIRLTSEEIQYLGG